MKISELVRGQKYKFWEKEGELFSVVEFIGTDRDGDPNFIMFSGTLARRSKGQLGYSIQNLITGDGNISDSGNFTRITKFDFNNGKCKSYEDIRRDTIKTLNILNSKNDTMNTFNTIQVAKFFENKKNVRKIEIMDGELGKFVELFTKSISVLEKMKEKSVELHEEFTKALDSDNYKEIKKLLGKNPELMEFMEVFSENKIFSIGKSEEKETENVGEFFNL